MSTRYRLALGIEGVAIPDYYDASPIWRYNDHGQLSRVALHDLPWPEPTVSRVNAWWRIFRDAMLWSDPKVRGFKSEEAFDAFLADGQELSKVMEKSLAPHDSLEITLSSPRFVRAAEPRIDKYRIFPDWGNLSPVWNGGPSSGPYNLLLEHLQLSDDLSKGLRKWLNDFLDTFDEEYPPNSGFSTAAESDSFLHRGRILTERFAHEIGGNSVVVLEYGDENWVAGSRTDPPDRGTEVSGTKKTQHPGKGWPFSRFRGTGDS